MAGVPPGPKASVGGGLGGEPGSQCLDRVQCGGPGRVVDIAEVREEGHDGCVGEFRVHELDVLQLECREVGTQVGLLEVELLPGVPGP